MMALPPNKLVSAWRAILDSTDINKEDFSSHASLVAQLVKNLPAMRETWVQSLGWEASLEKGKAAHSNTLAWKIPQTV